MKKTITTRASDATTMVEATWQTVGESLDRFCLTAGIASLTAANAGLALNPGFTIRRFRDGASTDNPMYLAGRERVREGMRLAGVPEG